MNSSMPTRHCFPVNIFRTLFTVGFAIIFVTAFWQIALAQGKSASSGPGNAPELFISPNIPEAQVNGFQKKGIQKKRNKAALRQRSVQVDKHVLKNKFIRMNLFDDADFTAERTHMKKGLKGDITWRGKLMGSRKGTASITVLDGVAAGSISTDDGQLFEINSGPDGEIAIEEIDLDQLPPHVNPLSPETEPFEDELSEGAGTENAPVTAADNGSIIDVMVVYTKASRDRYGVAGIEAKIINAVDAMNSANANSLIDARFRLVYTGEINYVETGNMNDALNRITNQSDGYADNVHALRDQYGADIVSVIVEDSNFGGIAWVMTPSQLSNNRMARLAFNVVYSGSLSSHTLTHEIGHNEGCAHDRANAGVSGSYDYSYGHRDTQTKFRTIMSYNCPGGCLRIPNFSNPTVLYNGAPTGIDHTVDPVNSADNVRTLNNNESIVANWRQSVEVTAPLAPDNLDAVALSGERIDVFWADNADNEEGFHLERSPNGVNTWTTIATLTANTTSHPDNGLAGSTTYFYRVRAYNGVGNSAYSNIDSATTLASLNEAPVAGFSFSTTGLTANFTDSSSDSDGTITSRSWSFGDGSVSTAINPSHTYATSGTYTVTLTVTDNDGESDSESAVIFFGQYIPPNDVVLNLPGTGVSVLLNDNTSSSVLHADTAEAIAIADVDGSGEDDIIVSFPAGTGPDSNGGTYISRNMTPLVLLDSKTAEQITVGDFDNNGQDDLLLDFGPDNLWLALDDIPPFLIIDLPVVAMAAGDVDSNGEDDMVLSFSGFATLVIKNLATVDVFDVADTLAVADVDNNGEGDVIMSFPAGTGPDSNGGTYISRNQGALVLLDSKTAEQIAVGDVDGSGQDDLLLDFGSDNLWLALDDTPPFFLIDLPLTALAAGDMDNNGMDDIIFSSTGSGTFVLKNLATFDLLDPGVAQDLATGNVDGN